MDLAAPVLTDLFIMFLAAKVAGALVERIGQPAVIGELLAGVALGPYALGWIGVPTDEMVQAVGDAHHASELLAVAHDVLAELGVVVLLFAVGLETRLGDILRVGVRAGVVSVMAVGLIGAQALGFTALVAIAGRHAVREWSVHFDRLPVRNAPLIVAVVVMLGLAALSGSAGLAAIVGAFIAGMVLAECREQYELETKVLPIYEFLVPIFFVITGSHVDWRIFLDRDLLGIALTVTGLTILGKLVGCSLGGIGKGWRSAGIIGVGMVPRGEVGLIVANVGRSMG